MCKKIQHFIGKIKVIFTNANFGYTHFVRLVIYIVCLLVINPESIAKRGTLTQSEFEVNSRRWRVQEKRQG